MTAPAPAPRGHQARVLTARYRDVLLGDAKTLLLLVGQAPVIGWLCTLVWGAVGEDTKSLYFVMCLSSLWFGCISACREIVKERPILERERLFGLSLVAYVASKVAVLAALSAVQVGAFQLVVEARLTVRGPMGVQTMALWGAALCGVGLGLLASALATTQERAVGAIPLLILPQILFSEFAIPREAFDGLVEAIELAMPVRWAYTAFRESAATDPSWLLVVASLIVLLAYAAGLAALTAAALLRRRHP